MISIRLNVRQKVWLQAATPAQRDAWMSKGPIEIGTFGDPSSNLKHTYRPFIRGVLVGSHHEDPKAANAEAEKILAEIKARPFEYVDEEALGIGTSHQTLMDRMDEATVAVETILHLGALVASGDKRNDAFEDFIQDFDEHTVKALKESLPFVGKFWEVLQKEDRMDDDEENAAEFLQVACDSGLLGFLVQVAHPVMEYEKSGKSASFSWGHYNTAWVYGESMPEVVGKAIVWAEKLDKAARKRAKAKTA